MKDLSSFLSAKLLDLERNNLLRDTIVVDNQLINFSSNDYLGLSSGIEAQFITGSTGSRLTTGTHAAHLKLENFIAEWKGVEAALVFSSGYLANLGSISCLVDSRDVVFTDELNHSCIFDGIRLSRAKKFIYKHNDMEHLQELLLAYRANYAKSMIITDSVFSMDGDKANLCEIVELAKQYSCFTYVDEAHATGLFGSQGAGLVEEFGLDIDVQMGTFSKAVGLEGAYIAGSKDLIAYLKNHARTFMFSTAMSPSVSNQILSNLELIRYQPQLRLKLHSNIAIFRKLLADYGIDNWINDCTAIFALECHSVEQALQFSKQLHEQGLLVMAIRPPTVKTPRLRICLSAKHSEQDLLQLVKNLALL